MHATLQTERLSKYVMQGDTRIDILDDISISFSSQRTYAICGISGTGKSTFIHILAGLDQPSAGTIYFNDKNLAHFSTRTRELFFNRSLGMVFQWPYLIRELSVLENVMLPGIIAGKDEKWCKERTHELLRYVGIDHKASTKPAALSGGQQQRVAFVRAIFNKPSFLIADEPTGSLDIKTGQALLDLMLAYHKEHDMGIIVSTHDEYVAQCMNIQYEVRNGKLECVADRTRE